ncbi:MAG: CofH family radical SAM protein [Saprospiraceae bacterium]|nr:CofH family radical SAM protein [Saprospiraceae bacterium]
MSPSPDLQSILQDPSLDPSLKAIANKVYLDQRISDQDCLTLFESGSLGFVGALANTIRERKHGHRTYFNRNFHIEPTNVCIYTCNFCSYSRLIKQREDGWEYSMEDMMDIVKSYDEQPVTEVHIVGGVMPQYNLAFYTELFRQIKAHRPELHIKGLTPVEYYYIFKKAKVSYEEGFRQLIEAGLDSMPGGGAEIFHLDIRKQIAADKCTGEQWLDIHKVWHQLGKRSNATILYGHIESFSHRVHHLSLLRDLQDETGGFQTFIPLKFRNQENQMSHIPEGSTVEDLRNYAISRIYLDNFDHLKAYWPMIGRTVAQMSLSFGVDDIDGTIDDTTKIYSMAGSEEQNPALSTKDLVKLIQGVGRHPLERDTLYQIITDFTDHIFPDEEVYRGYTSLPVVSS